MLLRPRQTEFVARAVAALRERGNALAVAPTGFGKTVAMAAIIGRLLAGVRQFPVRVKCATLAWHTMHAAMSGDGEISTE